MSDPILHLLDRIQPLVKASPDPIEIEVWQDLDEGALLQTDAPSHVKVLIDGPRLQLTPGDIAGVYPAPGSEESPDEFLPHIALSRRTLPWERIGPNSQSSTPWMALLVFRESDLKTPAERAKSPAASLESTTVQGVGSRDPATFSYLAQTLDLPADTPLQVLYVRNQVLKNALPTIADLRFLCHVKRKEENGVVQDTAIVIANRLPDAGPEGSSPQIHTAVLVSLEQRGALFQAGALSNANAFTALVVLHHWTFRPSQGGDFEHVVQAIKYRPNGGVVRFGNLARSPEAGEAVPVSGGFPGLLNTHGFFLDPLPHTQPGQVVYRSPLRPCPPAQRSPFFAIRAAPEEFDDATGEVDYSHAAAFEIGRLLAMADAGVLEDIRQLRVLADVIVPPLEQNPLPDALQKLDWVVNPAWHEDIWQFPATNGLLKDESALLQKGVTDVTGIGPQIAEWGESVLQELGQMATPSTPAVTQVDIQNTTSAALGQQFAAVENVAKS